MKPIRGDRTKPNSCKATGCRRIVATSGYCNVHYQKVHRWGNIHGKELNCAICARTFYVKSGRQRTCSKSCSTALKQRTLAEFRSRQSSVKVKRRCSECGNLFMAKSSQLTCSLSCRSRRLEKYEAKRANERRKTPQPASCAWCDKTFTPITHAKTCSAECRAQYTRTKRAAKGQKLTSRKCIVCGSKFKVGALNNKTITCSAKCRGLRATDIQKRSYLRRKEARRGSVLRAQNLNRRFRLTEQEFAQLLAQQQGRCAICGTSEPGTTGVFAVDHDHNTGRIRGLLCRSCNVGIGNLRDEPELLRAALRYLEQDV